MIDKMPIIQILNEFATVFGAGVLVIAIIGIILSVTIVLWFSVKINERVTYKNYENDKVLHKEEHRKIEENMSKNFDDVKEKIDHTKDLINGVGISVAKIEGHLFEKK